MAPRKRATERPKGNLPKKRSASKAKRNPAKDKNTASQQSGRTGAGRATHVGTYYQNRVSAVWGAVTLAEADAQPFLDLPANITLRSLFAETKTAVDDLTVHKSANGSMACQAKHKLALETVLPPISAKPSLSSSGNSAPATQSWIAQRTVSSSSRHR
jgi:hypothetical protein